MEIEERKKLVKKVAIMVIPVLLLVVGYFKFFYKGEGEETVTTENSTAVLDMGVDAKQVNRDANSKWDAYSIEDSLKQNNDNEKHINSKINIDDFLNMDDAPKANEIESVPQPAEKIEPIQIEEPVRNKPKQVATVAVKAEKKASSQNMYSMPEPKPKKSSNKLGFSDEQKLEMFGEEAVKPKAEPKQEASKKEEVTEKRRSFYTSDEIGSSKKPHKAGPKDDEYLPVVVHNDQIIKNGSTVRLRVTKTCIINGLEIPKNTYISGVANLREERVFVSVKSLKLHEEIVQTKLSAFEEDGIEGIYVPGGINQELANQSAQDAVGRTGATVNVPMFGSVTVGAKRKIADPTVKVISGYKLLLKNATNN